MMRKDWIEIELGKLCEVKMGQSPPSSTYNINKEGLPFFQGKTEFTEYHPIVRKWCNLPKKTADKNDVLLSVRAPVGATNIAIEKCAIGRGLAAISYNQCYKYVFYFLRLIETSLDKLGTGTTFKAISGGVLKSQKIPVFPLPEQRAIVSKIEELFSELDNGIANLKTAKEKLKIYRQAVLKKAFEGELTKKWREKQKSLIDWKIEIVKNIANSIQYGYTESSSKKPIGPKFLRITDIQNNSVNWSTVPYCKIKAELKTKYILKDGDLVFARTGATVGKSFLIKGIIKESVYASYLIRIRFPENMLDKYVWYFFQSPFYWNQIKSKQVGTGQPNVNGTKLGNLEIPICDYLEQNQIVQEIETRLSICDNILATIDDSLGKSEALRQSILKKAFEGKLLSEEEVATCRREPDWEPAEKLLERIKKEKNNK